MKKSQLFMIICLLGLIGLIVLSGCSVENALFIRATETPVPTSTSTPIPTPAATKTPLPTATLVATATLVPTATPKEFTADSTEPLHFSDGGTCDHWSTITTADAGEVRCVYGFVRTSFYDESSHYGYLIVSSDPNGFYFRSSYGYFEESEIDGRCVYATGLIQAPGSVPYMDVFYDIYLCN
jgi:hypothetical protein